MNPIDFAYYEIWRAESTSEVYSLVGTSTNKQFVDSTAILGNTYCYRVITVDLYGNKSSPSPSTCVFFSNQGPVPNPDPQIPPGSIITNPGGNSQQVIINPTATLSKENVICVYRAGDQESLSCALRYKAIYGLQEDQILGIQCSNIEILPDYISFQEEVEDPIREAIISQPISNRSVYCLILMPYVPGGFRDGQDVISSTSRLSRIFHPFEKHYLNPIYNKQIFNRYDGFDAFAALICTRIDGPEIVVNQWLNNIEQAKSRLQVNGKFYIDPYSAYTFPQASEYTSELVNFSTNYISRLGLTFSKTNQTNPSRDAFFSQVEEDSFFWGWGLDRGSLSYFKPSANTRAFFYNADFDGGFTIRSLDARSWPILAIRSGYIASAGNMSGTDSKSFLRPLPFMDSLYKGASIGEAMIYSQPVLNSNMACFGDPLAYFEFPSTYEEKQLIEAEKAWKQIETCLSQSIVCLFRKSNILKNIRNKIASGRSQKVQTDLVYSFDDIYSEFDETSWKNDYVELSKKTISFAVNRNEFSYDFAYPTLNQYLLFNNKKISSLVLDTLQDSAYTEALDDSVIEQEGSWYLEYPLQHYFGSFRFYHLEMEVAKNLEDFDNNLILFKDTFNSTDNWSYEDSDDQYKPFSSNGITSNYEGKKIKYTSGLNENLQRGEYYWFRIRQKDELQVFDWNYYRQIIFL